MFETKLITIYVFHLFLKIGLASLLLFSLATILAKRGWRFFIIGISVISIAITIAGLCAHSYMLRHPFSFGFNPPSDNVAVELGSSQHYDMLREFERSYESERDEYPSDDPHYKQWDDELKKVRTEMGIYFKNPESSNEQKDLP